MGTPPHSVGSRATSQVFGPRPKTIPAARNLLFPHETGFVGPPMTAPLYTGGAFEVRRNQKSLPFRGGGGLWPPEGCWPDSIASNRTCLIFSGKAKPTAHCCTMGFVSALPIFPVRASILWRIENMPVACFSPKQNPPCFHGGHCVGATYFPSQSPDKYLRRQRA